METESSLHDNLEFDTLSNAGLFYRNYEGKEAKYVWTAFDIFNVQTEQYVFPKKIRISIFWRRDVIRT